MDAPINAFITDDLPGFVFYISVNLGFVVFVWLTHIWIAHHSNNSIVIFFSNQRRFFGFLRQSHQQFLVKRQTG